MLPPELIEALAKKNAWELKPHIQSIVDQGGDWQGQVEQIVASARGSGWSNAESEKIKVYALYFSGNRRAAYEATIRCGFADADFDFFVLACIALYLEDQFEQAYALLSRRDADDPELLSNPDFMSFAGYIVLAAGRPIEESLKYFDIALKKGVNCLAFATNAYGVYFEAGKLEVVDQLRHLIHDKYSDDPQALYALSSVELARGYYPEGFRLAERRYEHPEVAQYINGDLLGKSRWRGEPIEGKTLLVHGEQGLGDTIMCARYLPLLLEMDAVVTVESQEAAISLLAHNYPGVEIMATQRNIAASSHFDYWVGAMSLPYLLNSTADSVPGKAGYLSVPDEHATHWQLRLEALSKPGVPRVGIAWSGNPRHRADRRRSIPLELVAQYVDKGQVDATFFVLQTDVPDRAPADLINVAEELVTLADTAALIQEMDLVITVDTSIVHIAGALGKKTWLLFPCRYDWRWGLEGEGNSWYDSVKVVRQSRHGDWKSVLDDVFLHRLPDFIRAFEGNS